MIDFLCKYKVCRRSTLASYGFLNKMMNNIVNEDYIVNIPVDLIYKKANAHE